MQMFTPGTQGNVLCTCSGTLAGISLDRLANEQSTPTRAAATQLPPTRAHLQNATERLRLRPLLPQIYHHPKPDRKDDAPTKTIASSSAALAHMASFPPKIKPPPNNFLRSSIGSVPLPLLQKAQHRLTKPLNDMPLRRSVSATTSLGCKILSQ